MPLLSLFTFPEFDYSIKVMPGTAHRAWKKTVVNLSTNGTTHSPFVNSSPSSSSTSSTNVNEPWQALQSHLDYAKQFYDHNELGYGIYGACFADCGGNRVALSRATRAHCECSA